MLTPHVIETTTGTAHPISNSKAVARGHHALAQRIRESRKRHRSTTLYEQGTVTIEGINYQQNLMPVLYGPGNLNADLN